MLFDVMADVLSWGAGRVREQLPACTEQWQEDVKIVGRSALGSGGEVLQAVADAGAARSAGSIRQGV